jgi:two-component system response regulator (stage 0 sporulation protein F)
MSAPVANPAILLVDDEPAILHLLRLIIKSLATSHTILTCADGNVALEQAMQQPTPLVITDYNLPGMNGLQLTAALKAHAPTTRVVLLSGYISADLERRARDRGVDYVVRKPFQVDSLIQIVRAALAPDSSGASLLSSGPLSAVLRAHPPQSTAPSW